MAYYIGVDVGGTNIKSGIIDDFGNIINESSIPTGADRPQDVVLQDILQSVRELIDSSKIDTQEIKSAGVGTPGMIDYDTGSVIYNNNLGWKNFHIAEKMTQALGISTTLENDADAAALGEVIAGSAKGAKSAMIVTLGTGVGVGIVIDNKIFRGSEFGHMVILKNGRPCKCGRKGCWESYASATGLIVSTFEEVNANPESILAKTAELEGKITGRTVFDAADRGCEVAKKVIDDYITNLSCGLSNLINGMNPEIISLGGGVANQGEKLLVPLREKVMSEIYEGLRHKASKIVACTLGYKAGLIGAAMASKNALNN